MSHIIGTESFLPHAAPEPDTRSALAHVRNPIGVMNQRQCVSFWHRIGCGLAERFRRISQRRKVLASLRRMECADDHPLAPTATGGSWLRIFDCWRCTNRQPGAAVQRPSSDDESSAPASPLVLDEIAGHFQHGASAKVGRAPDGSRVLVGADRARCPQHPRFRGRVERGSTTFGAGADGDDPLPGRTAAHPRSPARCMARSQDVELRRRQRWPVTSSSA